MKNILKVLLPFLIVGALLYQLRYSIHDRLSPFINKIISELGLKSMPCEDPILYTLGTFDTKFGISKTYFLGALSDAEKIWEKPFGKELFTYTSQASSPQVLSVNLIYDYRQEATSKLADLGIVVNDNRASYDMLKSRLTVLKADYESQKNSFSTSVELFKNKQLAYEREVESWNKKGGAPEEEYQRLEATRVELNNESNELEATQLRINDMVDEINALVVALNHLVSVLNLSVDQYNTVNGSRGESFEEGVYQSDGFKQEIDIYEFSSRDKLVRVLAHELGHALGLDHVEDPKAIMYRLNQGNNKTLTETDLDQLKTKCGVK